MVSWCGVQDSSTFFPLSYVSAYGCQFVQQVVIRPGGSSEIRSMGGQLERVLGRVKTKLRAVLLLRKRYDKIDKSESMRMEIRSRRARKLIAETLKIADSPGHRSYAL
ncbi:hypothetical protein Taro_036059 [Colocasia esculenta]|uniref:Uncharacterized protein n=1 Tax=Colocasia esculenta TaxID=4460 RepID=A0A843WCA0_COLES|nr:hypothetical protein [Colocasia esculenta]